ncbi:MAG: universal stress protein [Bacteroidales bacterium]
MYKLNHILVSLDLTEMDSFLIRYSNYIVEKFQPKTITFLHVFKSYDIPKELMANLPDMDEPLSDIIGEEIADNVNEHFNQQENINMKILVEEGHTVETLVQYTKDNKIDLTLMGKKLGYEGKGSTNQKVISLTPSSVLLISETTQADIKHMLVRIDFTKSSEMAVKMALRLQELTKAKISFFYVSKLPLQYFPQHTRKNEEEIKQHIDKISRKEYKKFMKRMKLVPDNYEFTSALDTNYDEAHVVYNQSLGVGADLIITGAGIKSGLSDVIVDSTSEKLAGSDKNISVFVVKDRKKSLGFLNKLFD